MEFGSRTITRSPAAMPSPRSSCAKRDVRSASSRYVMELVPSASSSTIIATRFSTGVPRWRSVHSTPMLRNSGTHQVHSEGGGCRVEGRGEFNRVPGLCLLPSTLYPPPSTFHLEYYPIRPILAHDLRGEPAQHLDREVGVGGRERVERMRAQERLQRLAEHGRIEHLAFELDGTTQQRVRLDRGLEDRDPRLDLRGRRRERHLAGMDVRGMDHLLAR